MSLSDITDKYATIKDIYKKTKDTLDIIKNRTWNNATRNFGIVLTKELDKLMPLVYEICNTGLFTLLLAHKLRPIKDISLDIEKINKYIDKQAELINANEANEAKNSSKKVANNFKTLFNMVYDVYYNTEPLFEKLQMYIDTANVNGECEKIKKEDEEIDAKEKKLHYVNERIVAKARELECANKELVAKVKELICTNEELNAKVNGLEYANKKLDLKVKELDNENEVLNARVKELNAKVKELSNANEELNANVKRLDSKAKKLSSRVDDLRRLNDTYSSDKEKLREELDKLNELNQKLCAENEELKESGAKAGQEKVRRWQRLYRAYNDVIDERKILRKQLEEITNEISMIANRHYADTDEFCIIHGDYLDTRERCAMLMTKLNEIGEKGKKDK